METTVKVSNTGNAGREALTGVPLSAKDLKSLLCNRTSEEHTGYELKREFHGAFAIVEKGHVYVGILYPEVLPFVEPLIAVAKEIIVSYEDGVASIHAETTGSVPIIIVGDDRTVWDIVAEHPTAIRAVSFYVLDQDELKLVATKPARVSYVEQE